MIKVGIECESLEGEGWGVGRNTLQFLRVVASRPELVNKYRFHLYFKSAIPTIDFLDDPIFIKKTVSPRWLGSFSIYYYLLLPLRAMFDRLNIMYFPNYMLPIIYFGRSITVLTNDIYYEIWNGKLAWRYRLAYAIFCYWAAWRSTMVMSVSESAANDVARLFKINGQRVFANANGVNLPAEFKISNLKFKIEDYILYLGQAFPRRHLRETILAFEKIAPEFPKLKLIAIGKDKYEPPIIKKLVHEINQHLGAERIIHHNYVPESDLPSYYANAKLFVYLSDSEAFGLPPLEALAYGTPSVAANQPINHEIYGKENPAAFFVNDPGNVDEIATTLRRGLTDELVREKILAQRERILAEYTWEKHADRLLKIVDRVIKK